MNRDEFVEAFCNDLKPLSAQEIADNFKLTYVERMDKFHLAVERQVSLEELDSLLIRYEVLAVTKLCMDLTDLVSPIFGDDKAAELFIMILKVTPHLLGDKQKPSKTVN